MKIKLTSNNITNIIQSPVNYTKLAYLEYLACSMKQCQLKPPHNAPENYDVGDEHDVKKIIVLSEYI